MTYAECVAQFPNAPAVYCMEISGDMGQVGVAPPPVIVNPTWQPPTALQLQVYSNAQGYIFCVAIVLGKRELYALQPTKQELINFSSGTTMKNFFGAFNTENLISNVDLIQLPPNVPFGLLALSSLNKNKICRVIPNSGGQFEVMGYPPQLSYLAINHIPGSVPVAPSDEIEDFTGTPPASNNESKSYMPYLLGAGLLLFILK